MSEFKFYFTRMTTENFKLTEYHNLKIFSDKFVYYQKQNISAFASPLLSLSWQQ